MDEKHAPSKNSVDIVRFPAYLLPCVRNAPIDARRVPAMQEFRPTRRIVFVAVLALFTAGALFLWMRDRSGNYRIQTIITEQPREVEDVADGESPKREAEIFRRDVEEGRTVFSNGENSDPHAHVKRAWEGHLLPALRELGARHQAEDPVERFSVPLFDGDEAVVVVRQFVAAGEEAGVFTGEVAGHPGSFVSLAYAGGAEGGSIQIPSRGEVYEIRSGEGGAIILSQVDVQALGECGLHHEHRGGIPVPEEEPNRNSP